MREPRFLAQLRRAVPSLVVLALLNASAVGEDAQFPAPKTLGEVQSYGGNVQRTMSLLATSTPERRNTVRVLFYGQSITEQAWWKIVADDLRRRFPHAHLEIDNRAIGGHASQMLVKTAEADLYPSQPDLVIFHVYGAHNSYEDILRRIRERTCAEILQQNDHVTSPDDFAEETDPTKLAPGRGKWNPFMNHAWLPMLAKKYGTEFCDQRAVWKQYLKDYALEPKALLKDGVHLNKHGEFLMAECVKAHLRYDPALGPGAAESWVKDYVVGKDVAWTNGKLAIDFEGSRVDVLAPRDATLSGSVLIDGKKPSEFPGCYAFTRTTPYPTSSGPCLLRVGSESPLQVEEWTLTLSNVSDNLGAIRFALSGSKTGADGEGTVGQRFVSKSRRVVIEPDDWNLDFCVKVHGPHLREGLAVKWQVVGHFADELSTDKAGLTVAQGLPNAKHRLEITGAASAPITSIRIYSPPLK